MLALLEQADEDNSGKLNLTEFERLLSTLYAQASSRVATHRFISGVCAPFCAVRVADWISAKPDLVEAAWSLVPKDIAPGFLVRVLSQEKTWIALLTGVFCKQLAQPAMKLVDYLWWGRNAEEHFYDTVSEIKDGNDRETSE